MGRPVRIPLERKKQMVADAAHASQPLIPAADKASLQRQADGAWRTVTAAAAVRGMDAAGFREVLDVLGLLPEMPAPELEGAT